MGALARGFNEWMVCAWLSDAVGCLACDPLFIPALKSVPTFLPARVPNQVFSEENYNVLMNSKLPAAKRLQAFHERSDWYRLFTGNNDTDIDQMITNFDKLGIVEERPGPTDLPGVPAKVWVESKPEPVVLPQATLKRGTKTAKPATASSDSALPARYRLRTFGKRHA